MKVKELIDVLSKLDPSSEVYCYCEDESLQTPDKLFSIFLIDSADETIAITERNDNREPTIRFDSGAGSRKLALLNITTDF